MNVRNILGFIIVALVVALTVVITHNFQDGDTQEIIASLPKNVDLAMKQVSYTETTEGVPRWTLRADSAAHSVGMGKTSIKNIYMTFFNQGELGDVTLTADNGTYFSDQQVVVVNGNVVIKSPKGYSFFTDSLKFVSEDDMIQTDKSVRIVSDSAEITGRGFRMNLDTRRFQLLHAVKAVIEGNHSEP